MRTARLLTVGGGVSMGVYVWSGYTNLDSEAHIPPPRPRDRHPWTQRRTLPDLMAHTSPRE